MNKTVATVNRYGNNLANPFGCLNATTVTPDTQANSNPNINACIVSVLGKLPLRWREWPVYGLAGA